jgi:hypothetical protein
MGNCNNCRFYSVKKNGDPKEEVGGFWWCKKADRVITHEGFLLIRDVGCKSKKKIKG